MRTTTAFLVLAAQLMVAGCVGNPDGSDVSDLGAAQRRARCDSVKARAALKGITNPLVIAGIANHETGMAQCAAEFSGAGCSNVGTSTECPATVGGVLGGGGDGTCASKKGGIGMFQLDAGLYADTLARYGNSILNVNGNTDAAISFIIDRLGYHCALTPQFANDAEVIAWLNAVTPSSAAYDQYMAALASCYNGCVPGATNCAGHTHDEVKAMYRDATDRLIDEFGASYWSSTAPATSYTYGGGAAICSSIGGPDAAWNYTCVNPRTTFPAGSTVYALAKITNVTADHRFKVEVLKNGSYSWEYTTPTNVVGTGWASAHFFPSMTNAAPGSYSWKLYVGVGTQFTLIDTVNFTVTGTIAPYTYGGGAATCGSIGGPDAAWNYTCVNPRTTFPAGSTAYALAKITNVTADHRFKVEVLKNGVYSWEYTTPANLVGTGWSSAHFFPSMTNAAPGSYSWKLYVGVGTQFTLIDTVFFTVST